MENAFYSILSALFVLKIFKLLSWLFGYIEKNTYTLKDKFDFKICNDTTWLTNNYNAHIVQYLPKQKKPGNGIWSVNSI